MDTDLESKQSYLRTEILDKGYSAESFYEYLIKQKENGGDVSNWTFDELKKKVQEFQSENQQISDINDHINTVINYTPSKPKQAENENNDSACSVKSQNSVLSDVPPAMYNEFSNKKIITSLSDKNNCYYNKDTNNTWEFLSECVEKEKKEVRYREITCIGPDKSPLSKFEKLTVKLANPQKNYEHSGLLSFFTKKTFFSYEITLIEPKIKVRRTHGDFQWLRNTFVKLYPGIYVPPIPLKVPKENASEEKMEKTMNLLEKFMNAVCYDVLFKNSSILYLFLTTEKEDNFITVMGKLDKMTAPVDLKQFRSRSEKIVLCSDTFVQDSIKQKQKFNGIKEILAKNNKIYENLNKEFKNLFREINAVSDRLVNISKIFKNFYDISIINGENKNFCQCFSKLELLFRDLSREENENLKNIKKNIKEYFNFVKLEYQTSIFELHQKYEYHENLFIKANQNLKDKKNDFFKKKNIEQWNLDPNEPKFDYDDPYISFQKMLPQETYIVNEIKCHFIYYAQQLISEFERFKVFLSQENNEMIENFINKRKIMYENNLRNIIKQ